MNGERNYRNSPIILAGYRKGIAPENKGRTYPPTRLEPDEIAAILDACGDSVIGKRNRAIIAMLYRTGIEIAEALQIQLASDVDLTLGHESIRAHGSRLTARTLALDAVALDFLRPWLAAREQLERPGEYLFCTTERGARQGNRVHAANVRNFLREIASKAGLTVRVHPHAFRHTLAAELLVEGWPVPYLQAQLGITSLVSLQNLVRHLNIRIPEDREVMEIIRTRPPGIETYAP